MHRFVVSVSIVVLGLGCAKGEGDGIGSFGTGGSQSGSGTGGSQSRAGAGGADHGSEAGGADSIGDLTLLGEHVLTWYSFQDNTPSNSSMSSSGRPLVPYVSVALPFRLLEEFGGTLAYGDRLFVEFLEGRPMPNGSQHTGWVQLDDFCGDNEDDSYCYQNLGGQSYPNIDLWIGDFTESGLDPSSCMGPAGSGQELTAIHTGDPGAAWVADYGGRSVGTGECGDSDAARDQQPNCWYYTPPAESAEWCSSCTALTCAP